MRTGIDTAGAASAVRSDRRRSTMPICSRSARARKARANDPGRFAVAPGRRSDRGGVLKQSPVAGVGAFARLHDAVALFAQPNRQAAAGAPVDKKACYADTGAAASVSSAAAA